MDKEPRLLVWNYTPEEKQKMDDLLREIGAPPAHGVDSRRSALTIREIVDGTEPGEEDFKCDEKVVLFYNVPDKGVMYLMRAFRSEGLPQAIYAVVTEHSIEWPFPKLLEHLLEEREEMRRRHQADAGGTT
jgi:hypothetical protein